MKQTWKRVAALFLALAMSLSLLSVNVWAAESAESAAAQAEASIETDEAKKAIIMLHGFGGSALKTLENITTENLAFGMGSQVWMPSSTTVGSGVQMLFYASELSSVLGCNKKGVSNHDLSAVQTSPIATSVGAIGTYTKLMHLLYNTYDKGTDKVYDVQYFAYDWRLSMKDNAKKLDEYIRNQCYSKVVLIGHSMGGMVAAQYIQDGHADRVEKLITIGTPYYGAPKTLDVLETGHFMEDKLEKLMTALFFQKLGKNLPSTYEMIPNEEYVKKYPMARLAGISKDRDLPKWETGVLMKLRHNSTLYRKAMKNLAALEKDGVHAIDKVDSYVINMKKGDLSTIGTVIYKFNALYFKRMASDLALVEGDGTVPLTSSSLDGRMVTGTEANPIVTVEGDHTLTVENITSSSPCWKYITAAIDGKWKETFEKDEAAKAAVTTQSSGHSMTKIRIEGEGDYTITDNKGETLVTVQDGEIEIAEGYEDAVYTMDEQNKIVLAFLKYGMYHVNVERFVAGFECDVIQYSNYEKEEIESIKEYVPAEGETSLCIETK